MSTFIDYFTRNGAPQFKAGTNPVEYMLDVVWAAKHADPINWLRVWKASPEYQGVCQELERLSHQGDGRTVEFGPAALVEFAASFPIQHT